MSGKGNYWNEPMIDLDEDGTGDFAFEYTSSLGELIDSSVLAYFFFDSPAIIIYEKTIEILVNQSVIALDEYRMIESEKNMFYFRVICVGFLLFGIINWYINHRKRRNKKDNTI